MVAASVAQDYEVADVKCHLHGDPEAVGTSFSYSEGTPKQKMVARLKKPEYFRGHPLFADDLKVNPYTDPYCSIVPEPGDKSARIYRLTITDLSRCGVSHHSVSSIYLRRRIELISNTYFLRVMCTFEYGFRFYLAQ